MPGRNVFLITASDRERYECPFCALALEDPLQLECGDRICNSCAKELLFTEQTDPMKCLKCGIAVRYDQCFKDKACAKDLSSVKVRCRWHGCKWTGLYCGSLKHERICQWMLRPCVNCNNYILQREMPLHLDPDNYDNGCYRLQRSCLFKQFGCKFKGTFYQMDQHESSCRNYHSYLIKVKPKNEDVIFQKSLSQNVNSHKYEVLRCLHSIEKSMTGLTFNTEEFCIINKFMEVQRAQLELKRMMCGKSQVAYIYDRLLPSSSLIYEFKVNNISQLVNGAKPYVTEEICTGPRGYIIAYLIYLNGEDTKDTWGWYMSVYLLIKQGGYFDDDLEWPFDLPVTLTLLLSDQTHSHYQMTHQRGLTLTPATAIPSYHVVSGSTHFAPTSVLSKSIYVDNDCIHLLCSLSK